MILKVLFQPKRFYDFMISWFFSEQNCFLLPDLRCKPAGLRTPWCWDVLVGHSDKAQVRCPDDFQMCGDLGGALEGANGLLCRNTQVQSKRSWVHLETTSNAQHRVTAGNHGKFLKKIVTLFCCLPFARLLIRKDWLCMAVCRKESELDAETYRRSNFWANVCQNNFR